MNTIPYLAYDATNPLPLPRLGSWPDSVHIFDQDSAYALAAAEAARRPLLVRGEPGTGKSQLARAAAVARQRLFLSVVVNARTTAQDLQWQFDAVGRLGEAQLLAQAQDPRLRQYLHPRRFLSPGPLWWALDWHSAQAQWQECTSPLEPVPSPPEGWQPAHGSVVLIDEIDKADTDLPNGLLETLGNGDFTVPYLRASVRQAAESPLPLVIITTNEERELPAAFLRRCLVLPLALPEEKTALLAYLCSRGAAHFGAQCAATVQQRTAELVWEDRTRALAQALPPPGQAEYLDLLRAVAGLASTPEEQLRWIEEIGRFVLRKSPEPRG
jgi:MoxR-like ATPase